VLATGSRDWRDYSPIEARLALYPTGTILIHGDCGKTVRAAGERASWQGADKIAGYVGARLGHITWPLPYFADLGKRGGPARNQAMFDVLRALKAAGFACFVEAFPLGKSSGTRGMLRIVESYNDAAFYDATKREKHHDPVPVCVTEGV
jgi:hypothetical protein